MGFQSEHVSCLFYSLYSLLLVYLVKFRSSNDYDEECSQIQTAPTPGIVSCIILAMIICYSESFTTTPPPGEHKVLTRSKVGRVNGRMSLWCMSDVVFAEAGASMRSLGVR